MKAVLLDGSSEGDRDAAAVGWLLARELSRPRCELTAFVLRRMRLSYCLGCFGCWTRSPGRCVVDDDAQEVTAAVAGAELLVLLTPITFGGYSSALKRGLDRTICLALPFLDVRRGVTRHRPRYRVQRRLLAIGLQERPDEESAAIFRSLVSRNAANLDAVTHAAGVFVRGELPDAASTALPGLVARLGVAP